MMLNLDGEPVIYNPDLKVLKVTIKEPFFSAGKILSWEPASAGLGFNEKIINFIIQHKLRLIVHVSTVGSDYWQSWDKIEDFLKNNNCDWKLETGRWLKVISWRTFIGHHPHVEA